MVGIFGVTPPDAAPPMDAPASERETEPPAAPKYPDLTRIVVPLNPPGFAVLEIMGHRKRAGWVEEVTIFGAKFARVYLAQPGEASTWTVFEDYGGTSIFGTMWCTEELARAAAAELNRWEQPLALRQLPARTGVADPSVPPWSQPDDDHEDEDQNDEDQGF